MKLPLPVLLAACLAGVVYLFPTPAAPSSERLMFTSDEPMKDIDQCLRVYGKKIEADFHRTYASIEMGGRPPMRGGLDRPGANYGSKEGKLEVTLRPRRDHSELVIKSYSALSPGHAGIFRWCAQEGRRIPLEWNDVVG